MPVQTDEMTIVFFVYYRPHICRQLKVLQCNYFIRWKMAVKPRRFGTLSGTRFQRALWEDCSRLRHESPPFIVFQARAHGHWFECDSQDLRQTTDICCFWCCKWTNFGDFMITCSIVHDFLGPVQSTESQYHVWKETEVYYETSKGNKYEIGGKYIFQYFLSQLYNWVILYITAGIREPLLALALKLLLNAQSWAFILHSIYSNILKLATGNSKWPNISRIICLANISVC